VNSPNPGIVLDMIFPQFLMKRKCERKGFPPVYSLLYRSEQMLSFKDIAELTKPNIFTTINGVSSATLQPHEMIGEKYKSSLLEISMTEKNPETRHKAPKMKQDYYNSCMATFHEQMNSTLEVSSSMKSLYTRGLSMAKREGHVMLPHFEGFAPGSDCLASELYLINETIPLELALYAIICYTANVGIFNLSIQRKKNSFIMHVALSAMAGIGKSTLIEQYLRGALVPYTNKTWGEQTDKAIFQGTKADTFCINISGEITPGILGQAPITELARNIWKTVLGDQMASLSRTIVGKTEYYTKEVVVNATYQYTGCINTPQKINVNRREPLNNRWYILVPGTCFMGKDSNNRFGVTGSNTSDPAQENRKKVSNEIFRDKQTNVAHITWFVCMGLIPAPRREMMDMIISRMRETNGLWHMKSPRHLGRMMYLYDTLMIKTAAHIMFCSAASPMVTWGYDKVVATDKKTNKTTTTLEINEHTPAKWNYEWIRLCALYMTPSWDIVLGAWSVIYGHDRACAHRLIQNLMISFGLNLPVMRDYMRYYDQLISWARVNIDGVTIYNLPSTSANKAEAFSQMRTPNNRAIMSPLFYSTMYWPCDGTPGWSEGCDTTNQKARVLLANIEEANKPNPQAVKKAVKELVDISKKPLGFEKDKSRKSSSLPSTLPLPSEMAKSISAINESATPETPLSDWETLLNMIHLDKDELLTKNPKDYKAMSGTHIDSFEKTLYPDLPEGARRGCLNSIRIPDPPEEPFERFSPRGSHNVGIGAYNAMKDIDGMPVLPFAIVGADSTGKLLVNLNYMQVCPDRRRDWIYDFVKESNGMSKGDDSPETTWFMSVVFDMKEMLPFFPESVPITEAPTTWKEYCKMLHKLLRDPKAERKLMPVMRMLNAPPGSTESKGQSNQHSGGGENNTASDESQHGDGGNKNNKKKKYDPFAANQQTESMDVDPSTTAKNKKSGGSVGGGQTKMNSYLRPTENDYNVTQHQFSSSGGKQQQNKQGDEGEGGSVHMDNGMMTQVCHISLIFLLTRPEQLVEHEIEYLTSENTTPGRKVALYIPSSDDPKVPMVVTLGKGRGSTRFANLDHISKESVDILSSVHYASRKREQAAKAGNVVIEQGIEFRSTTGADSDTYIFGDTQTAVTKLPPKDEETYFCEGKMIKEGMYNVPGWTDSFPVNVMGTIETLENMYGYKPSIFKDISSVNSSKKEIHEEFNRH